MASIKASIQMYKTYLMRAAMVWAACVVLFLVAYIILLKPQIKNKTNLQNTLNEKKQLYESAQQAADEQTKIRLNEEIEDLRVKLENFVVNQEDSANLTFDIGQIASKKELSLFSIKNKTKRGVSEKNDGNSISENHLDINFFAGFNQFATFVNALERHQPILFVDEFSIARSNRDDSNYKITIDVATFVKKQEKEIANQFPTPDLGSKI